MDQSTGGVITFSRKVNLRKPYLPSIQSKVVPNCSQAIFRTDNGIWHGVSKVKSDYPRISLALYYYEKRSLASIFKAILFGRMTKFKSHTGPRSLIPYFYHKYYFIRALVFKSISFLRSNSIIDN